MAATTAQPLYARATNMITGLIETVVNSAQSFLKVGSPDTVQSGASLSSSQTARDFRQIQLPEAKSGLGSLEGDLIVLLKKYLEIVGLVFFVWLLGYLHFSVSWILLAVFIYLFRQRQRSLFKERHKMLTEINNNEEQFIKARLDELPSWVFFPDVERAEWVNRIIKQAWPYANRYLEKDIFREVMIPLIRSASPVLADFAFEKLDLGEIPPRIGGVKVYSDNVRDQIMMDLEVFYAGDAQIKAKVKGIVCGIRDIQFVGEVRVILSPLINTIPLVGAVSFFFLRRPSIDFKLTDAGTLMDIPGLNDLMLVQINDIVASLMVLPNRLVVPLVKDLQVGYLRWSNPQGVIRVFVFRARDLIKADISILGKGKSDPFVRVKALGSAEFRTKTINNTTDPEWNEVFEFVVEQCESESIEFEVFDEDPGKDDFIGRASYPLSSLVNNEAIDTWLTLKDVKKGSLNVSLQYFTLSTEKAALEAIERASSHLIKREKLSRALLVCFIDRCTNLPPSKKTRREPNPFCRIRVDSTESKTATLDSQTNPKFEHISQILCSNPLQQKIVIDICDARSNNEVIAYFELPIKQVFNSESMTIETQAYPLRSNSGPLDHSTIILRLSLSILSTASTDGERLISSTPSPKSSKSFDGLSNSNTNVTPSLKRSSSKGSSIQTPAEDKSGGKSLFSGLQLQSKGKNTERQSGDSDRKSMIIPDDPDLVSTRYGRIQLSIRYANERKSLSVTVHKCSDLINVHQQNLPDPYIRLYLLPDFKKDKKKTKAIHDCLHPVYGELFEWNASLNDVRRQRLFLSVKNNSPLFAQEETYMGDLQIDLSNLDQEKISTAWYALQEPNTSGGGILKIKYDMVESSDYNTAM